jgi:DNA-binding transcriptional MerR regulator
MMTERTFTIDAVCDAADVSRACAHKWINLQNVDPIYSTRRGVYRPFTLQDAVHLAAIKQLRALGLPASRAAAIIGRSPLQTAGQEVLSARVGDAEIRLDMTAIAERVRMRLLA